MRSLARVMLRTNCSPGATCARTGCKQAKLTAAARMAMIGRAPIEGTVKFAYILVLPSLDLAGAAADRGASPSCPGRSLSRRTGPVGLLQTQVDGEAGRR